MRKLEVEQMGMSELVDYQWTSLQVAGMKPSSLNGLIYYHVSMRDLERDNFVTTVRFFIYTFIGSLGMLASLIYLYTKTPDASFAFESLMSINLGYTESIWVGAAGI